jgi:competence protein ComEA
MRRVLGAGVLIIGLGASELSYLFFHRGHAPPDPAVAPPASVVSVPVPDVEGRSAAGAARPRPASSSVPPSFQRDPLAFLSTAPPDSLDLLPGIGPVLASRIVAARRGRGSFTSWDDVLHVQGIGPLTIQRLQALASRR